MKNEIEVLVSLTSESNYRYNFSYFLFSGGEPSVTLPEGLLELSDTSESSSFQIVVYAKLKTPADFLTFCCAVDALKRVFPQALISAVIPYFPGGRQDRVCNQGEAFTLKVYADIVNSMQLYHVYTYEAHSMVTPALLNNCTVIPMTALSMAARLEKEKNRIVVAPDAGAEKRAYLFAENIGIKDILVGAKRRTSDGLSVSFGSQAIKDGSTCIIVDDLCDGGATFIPVAQHLKENGAYRVILVVAHGIFRNGFEKLYQGGIDKIITTNSFYDYMDEYTDPKKLEIVDIKPYLLTKTKS